jgi:hypothetical protein
LANRTPLLLTAKLLFDFCRELLPLAEEQEEPHGEEESEALDDTDRASETSEFLQRWELDFRERRCDTFADVIGGEKRLS